MIVLNLGRKKGKKKEKKEEEKKGKERWPFLEPYLALCTSGVWEAGGKMGIKGTKKKKKQKDMSDREYMVCSPL